MTLDLGGVCTILTHFLKSTHEDGNISNSTFLFSLALNAVQLLKCNCKNGAKGFHVYHLLIASISNEIRWLL